jgi:hypothetical protein
MPFCHSAAILPFCRSASIPPPISAPLRAELAPTTCSVPLQPQAADEMTRPPRTADRMLLRLHAPTACSARSAFSASSPTCLTPEFHFRIVRPTSVSSATSATYPRMHPPVSPSVSPSRPTCIACMAQIARVSASEPAMIRNQAAGFGLPLSRRLDIALQVGAAKLAPGHTSPNSAGLRRRASADFAERRAARARAT